MRNLKRALSLALAVVMVVGLMVVGAGAVSVEDFGDAAEIKNKEAVGLLVDLGVIQGGNDGNFAPNGTLTRGQFAKIAYLVRNTQTDFGRYAGTGIAKDAAGHWAEGALVWCNTWRNQIITGGNDGNFYPDDTLTVVQCAVMMLRVLGYNNYLEGFTGAGWEIRTLNKADEVGLMKGLEDLKAGDPISRDDACQMAYNAMFINTVRHTEQWNPTAGTMVPTGYENIPDDEKTSLATSTFAITKEEATVMKVDENGKAYSDADGTTEIEGLTGTPDMVGVKVAYYTKDGKILSAAPAASEKVVATIDGGQYSAKVGPRKDYEAESDAVIYVNGAKADDATGIKAGSVVELISNDADAKIEVVRVTNKTVDVLEKDPEVSKDGKKLSIDFKTSTDITEVAPKTVVGYENLKKGDVVLFVAIGGVTYIEKTTVTTGKITSAAADKSSYTVGGKALPFSKLANAATAAATTDFENEYNFYLDNGGNIVAFATAGEAPTIVTKYAVVTDFGYVTTGADTGIGGSAGTTTFQVQLLFPEGNSDVVEFNSIKIGDDTFTPKDETHTLNADKIAELKGASGIKGTIVSYHTDKDDKYVLEVAGTALNDGDITGNKANFADDLVGNRDTVFLVKVGTEKTVRVLTGIANLPTATDANAATVSSYIVDKGFVTLAYLEIPGINGQEATDLAYFLNNAKAEETANGYEVKAIVGGKLTTLSIERAKYTGALATMKGWADVTYVDGKISTATAYSTTLNPASATSGILTDITAVGGGIIKFGTTPYQLADDAEIVRITANGAETITADKIPTHTDSKQYDAYVEIEALNSDMIVTLYVYEHSAG